MSESENYFTGKILNLAFQTSAISMALLRYADNIVIEANDTFFSMFEIVRKELIGNSLTGLGLIEKKDWDLFMFTLKETGSIRNADINYSSRRNTAGSALISFETIDSGKEKFILITLDNITDHKSIEKQLNDYESRYQDVFEHMSEGIAYCKMLYENGIPVDWLYISVNKSFESLTGLKDAAGKKVSEVIPGIKEKDPEIFEIYSRVSLTGKSEKLEFYVSALGQWFHLSVYSSEKEHFVAIFDVITERKLTEESLVKKESLLSAGLKLACLGYWEYDAMIDEFTFNDQLYSILHTTTEKENGYQMSSKAFSKKFIHPDDVQFVIKQIEQTSETIDPGYSHQFEHRVIFGDGGTGYVSVSFFVSKNERGGSIKTFGVMQDITDRRIAEEKIKESEEKFRQLAENIDVVFWLTEWENKKLLYVNPSFEKMYGLSVESAYENRLNWLESLHPEDKEGIRREFNTQAGMGEPAFAEYRIIREDGTIHWILDRNFPIKDNSGKVYRIVSFAEDITEQKRYENELKDSKEHAERSDKLKDAFIANISHEIKTPLNGILGMTGLIRNSVSKYLNNEEKEFFNAIDWASARIIRTIDMILNFSRLQVGDFPVKPVRLNLTAMIQNLINEYTLVAGRKELLLTFENNAGHFELLGDEYCIGQALSNLIENAIKYTTKGGVKIELSLSGESDLILKVQDSGIGITEDYLPHIFEPYSQEEIGYNRGYEGVGLGMSLVKRYLELNKAIITVQSRKNAGTVFTIIFSSEKIIRNEGKNEAQDIMGRLPSEVHSIEIEKPSVLIVEDDSINLLYIRSVLKKRYRVEGVYTASRALAALRIRKFNLILMDISLKGEMNGLELTRKLKADPEFRHIPVIAVTGHTSPQDKQNCMNAGCDEFLPKPFSDMELLDRIEIFLKA